METNCSDSRTYLVAAQLGEKAFAFQRILHEDLPAAGLNTGAVGTSVFCQNKCQHNACLYMQCILHKRKPFVYLLTWWCIFLRLINMPNRISRIRLKICTEGMQTGCRRYHVTHWFWGKQDNGKCPPSHIFSSIFKWMCKICHTTINYRDGNVSLTVPKQEKQGKKPELQYNSASFWTQL